MSEAHKLGLGQFRLRTPYYSLPVGNNFFTIVFSRNHPTMEFLSRQLDNGKKTGLHSLFFYPLFPIYLAYLSLHV
jgi:hypothetical protein